jgi:hypothetical protein
VTLLNCWEFKECGRQPGGDRVDDLGVCPASVEESYDGLNAGCNGGRICWAVSGHFAADGKVRCATAHELVTCMACEFFKRVLQEEGIYDIELVGSADLPKRKGPDGESAARDGPQEG